MLFYREFYLTEVLPYRFFTLKVAGTVLPRFARVAQTLAKGARTAALYSLTHSLTHSLTPPPTRPTAQWVEFLSRASQHSSVTPHATERGGDKPGEMDDDEFNELLWQARRGETAAVLAAVDLDPALLTRANANGDRLLHWACQDGHLELATGLLDRGRDVHARCNFGWDALYCASWAGHLPVAALLLDRGADPCTRGDNWIALGIAAVYGRDPVVLLLLSRGADLAATMTCESDPVELKTALELCGQHTYSPLSDEELEQRREEMRAAFAAGPHPSQVQRRCEGGSKFGRDGHARTCAVEQQAKQSTSADPARALAGRSTRADKTASKARPQASTPALSV